jgi:sugar lactone lactonase YvrE
MKKQLLTMAITVFTTAIFAQTNVITTIAGNGTVGSTGDGGAATAAELSTPWGIAVDAVGNVYIADQNNHRIRKTTTAGVISTLAGIGTAGYSGDGGAATAAQLHNPQGVTIDAAGNFYIADADNQRVRKINTNGIISTVAGNGTAGYSGDGAAATAAEVNNPIGVAVDASGNIYIADGNNSRLRKVNTSGIMSTLAGNGTFGYNGDGIAATTAELEYAVAVAVDVTGNVYIVDQNNQRIRKVNTGGIISTIAGNGTAGHSGDGAAATAAELNNPRGVAVDAAGNIYIADYSNNRIRKVTTDGMISTIAGNGTAGYNGDGGLATDAEINLPTDMAVDLAGNLYIADDSNNRIRKVEWSNTNNIEQFAGNNNQIEIYPNPATTIIHIELKTKNDIMPIQITDILGQEMMHATLQQDKTSIDVSNLQAGVYFITTTSKEVTSINKVIINK